MKEGRKEGRRSPWMPLRRWLPTLYREEGRKERAKEGRREDRKEGRKKGKRKNLIID